MGELVLRDSFDIICGCANSRPGRLRIPEVMRTDGPGFSLCAAPLESSGPVFRSGMVRTAVERTEVQSFPDQREVEGLSEHEESILSHFLVDIQTDSTIHWWLTFITTGSSAGSQVQQGG